MGLKPTAFTLRERYPNVRVLLVLWLAYLPLNLKVVGLSPIHSQL